MRVHTQPLRLTQHEDIAMNDFDTIYEGIDFDLDYLSNQYRYPEGDEVAE
jgi:hypothetical protein